MKGNTSQQQFINILPREPDLEEVQSERARSPLAIFTPKAGNPHDIDIEWHEVRGNEGGDRSGNGTKKTESKQVGKSSNPPSQAYNGKPPNPESQASVLKQPAASMKSTPLDHKMPVSPTGNMNRQLAESVEPTIS